VRGAAISDHLEQIATTKKVPIEEVVAEYFPDHDQHDELPDGADFVWKAFVDLSVRRGATMGGLLPITWEATRAWSELYQVLLEPWELRAIDLLDRAFLGVMNARPGDAADRDQHDRG